VAGQDPDTSTQAHSEAQEIPREDGAHAGEEALETLEELQRKVQALVDEPEEGGAPGEAQDATDIVPEQASEAHTEHAEALEPVVDSEDAAFLDSILSDAASADAEALGALDAQPKEEPGAKTPPVPDAEDAELNELLAMVKESLEERKREAGKTEEAQNGAQSGEQDGATGVSEALVSETGEAPESAGGDNMGAVSEEAELETTLAESRAMDTPDQSIADESADLMGVDTAAEADFAESTAPTEVQLEPSLNAPALSAPEVPVAAPVAVVGDSNDIDAQIAAQTEELLEVPAEDPLPVTNSHGPAPAPALGPAPQPAPTVVVVAQISAAAQQPAAPVQAKAKSEPESKAPTNTVKAPSAAEAKPAGPSLREQAGKAWHGSIAWVDDRVNQPVLRVINIASAPLAKQPAGVRRAAGWVAVNTLFLAGALWAYVLVLRPARAEPAVAGAFDFSTSGLPTPDEHGAGEHESAHGDGAQTGKQAAGGHGESKDAGHGAEKKDEKKDAHGAPAGGEKKAGPLLGAGDKKFLINDTLQQRGSKKAAPAKADAQGEKKGH
jgi:hypothetical protein